MGECPYRKVAGQKIFWNAIMCVQLGNFAQDCLFLYWWGRSEIWRGETEQENQKLERCLYVKVGVAWGNDRVKHQA